MTQKIIRTHDQNTKLTVLCIDVLSSVMCSLRLMFPESYVPLTLTLIEVMTINPQKQYMLYI